MATVFKRRWLTAIPKGAEIITRAGEQFAIWTDGNTQRKRRAPLTPDGSKIILEATTYTIEFWDQNDERRSRGTKFVERDSAQELAEQVGTRRRETAQERFD